MPSVLKIDRSTTIDMRLDLRSVGTFEGDLERIKMRLTRTMEKMDPAIMKVFFSVAQHMKENRGAVIQTRS